MREVTGKPILFVGVGEKTEALEAFHPERVASRILGMGDVLSLIEQVQTTADHEKAARFAAKIAKGRGFDFTDLREQLAEGSTGWGHPGARIEAAEPGAAAGRARPGGRAA